MASPALALSHSFADLCPNAIDTGARSDDREAWLAARMQGWTASEIPALLGFNKRKSPLAVYAAKMGRAIDQGGDDEFLRWGNRFEAPILDEYRDRTGHDVDQVGALLQARSHPFILATLDGMDWTIGKPLEVKTFGWWASEEWDAIPGEVPKAVWVQVQVQIAVTGVDEIPVLSLPLNERKLRVLSVARHAEFQKFALVVLEEHWERFKRGLLPSVDGHETTRLALDAIYSESSGSTITLSQPWAELTDEYGALTATERVAKKRKDEIKNLLRAELGEAGYGLVGDGRQWSLLNAAGPSHECSKCGNVDRGKGSRRPRLSGEKE
jgi:putative phage-type endonuclease